MQAKECYHSFVQASMPLSPETNNNYSLSCFTNNYSDQIFFFETESTWCKRTRRGGGVMIGKKEICNKPLLHRQSSCFVRRQTPFFPFSFLDSSSLLLYYLLLLALINFKKNNLIINNNNFNKIIINNNNNKKNII